MDIFGLESLLLDFLPKDVEKYDFNSAPLLQDGRSGELHLGILDNGRSQFTDGYRDLLLCIDCRACARQCPFGKHVLPWKRAARISIRPSRSVVRLDLGFATREVLVYKP